VSKDEREVSVTVLLKRWSDGDQSAFEGVVARLYADLRRIARNQMRREYAGHTLQPTALVHEVCLRLLRQEGASWQSREQFLAVTARLMRRILVDHARQRHSAKRGSGAPVVPLEEAGEIPRERAAELVALDEALSELSAVSPDHARIIELRYFGGLTIPEIAAVLNVSPATVSRGWRSARAWLHKEVVERIAV
jgi:RNA polymerase sigma factor (TIGR02999 family)